MTIKNYKPYKINLMSYISKSDVSQLNRLIVLENVPEDSFTRCYQQL